jgi:DNA-binding beta-propeller fold protein YncE
MLRARLVPFLVLAVAAAAPHAAAQSFVNFESGQVRPLAMSPDGSRLFAVNTPDNRLEIFTIGAAGLTHAGSVPVGLEPIAVAARSDAQVWVVNHLSDSVSVVDVASNPPRVVRTFLTCDEPRDIVFAGPANARAFVTTARRGQNCTLNQNPNDAGLPRALVQVWDDTSFDTTLVGTPIATLELFGDTPRALARSADGNTVYAGIFKSGNQTTTLGEGTVCDGGAAASACGAFLQFPGGMPAPNVNFEDIPGPEVGLIAKFDIASGQWRDPIGRDWSAAVKFELPDFDVFAIDAAAPIPVQTASFAHVGTVLFNIATNPVSGKVYVSNTDARNEVRFEGPGVAFGSTTVQGRLHEARITVLDGASVLPRHLNKHIDYAQRPAPAGVKEKSLATPVEMAVTSDGATLYVAAFGSSKIGVFDTAALENDTFVPDAGSHIAVSGGGPTGLVLDEARGRLYVATRFDDAISVVDTALGVETAHVSLHNPEPSAVVEGRRLLYDATFTSSNGEASCSSCHVFGDLDDLAWDLGNPDEVYTTNPLPTKIPAIFGIEPNFHPLKGPMTTQSLRGMADHGAMHWRGDRTTGNDPGGDVFDEDGAFKKFNPAFVGLIGRTGELNEDEMQAFTDFILTVTYPPNPNRRLDNTLNAGQQAGRDLYFGRLTDVLFNCNGCHELDPSQGFFGSSGFSTFEGETQMFKVPHLRNVYTKIGMFGRPSDTPRGPQIRGYGVLHDGSIDTVRRFLGASVFDLTAAEQNDLERFMFVFDSNLNPIVGQQLTLDAANAAIGQLNNRLNLMLARDDALECEVIVKGTIAGEARGGYRLSDGTFQMDRAGDVRAEADVRALALTPGQELTYTCVPPGAGARIGVDRDEDGVFDRDELDVGSDPADGARVPATPIRASSLGLKDDAEAPIDPTKRRFKLRSGAFQGAPSGVVAPAFGSDGDPTLGGSAGGGGEITVHGNAAGNDVLTIPLPASGWTPSGNAANPGYRYSDKRNVHGPITSISLRSGRLRISGKGAGLYSLADAPHGSFTVRVELGSQFGFCAVADAKLPVGSHDTAARFNGTRNAPIVAECPPRP